MRKNYQKNIFLDSEGDNWFDRNKNTIHENVKIGIDFFISFVNKKNKILEIGCSDGKNLNYLSEKLPHYELDLYGIDPSKKAIESGKQNYRKIDLKVGTSDQLKYGDKFFDLIICGFFLYLVDRNLIFKTVSEIDRILKEGGYLIIVDFDVPTPFSNDYKHYKGVQSYKNDYSKFFIGGGHYTLIGKKQFSHENKDSFHQSINERISSAILYKELIKNIY
tara:strand:+ start:4018 stop:4677 length:660 start_codon:yes stop_codon:yes gene_type:complete